MKDTIALIRVFSYLSLLTVGGGMAAFPELKVLTVDVHHWLTFRQLIHLYSIGQIAPGPNMMMIVTIGHMAGGVLGAIVVLFAFFGPTAVLAWSIGRLWSGWQIGLGANPLKEDLHRLPLVSCWLGASPSPVAPSPA